MTREVSRTELRARLAAGDAVVIVDVRTAEEFVAGHIEGAIHVPVAEIEANPSRLPLGRPLGGGGRRAGRRGCVGRGLP